MGKNVQTNALRAALIVMIFVGGVASATAQDVVRTDCDDSQNSTINGAIFEAGLMFLGAGDDLTNIQNGGDTTLFVNWFGEASPEAISRVTNTLTGAYYALGDAGFDCGCNISPFDQWAYGASIYNTVAWTLHNDPKHLIHLCPLFFSLDFTEFTVGTLIHELTHLYGTHDVSEAASCAPPDHLDPNTADFNLARSSPDKAIDNADNYRLYVLEWDPAQPSSYVCPAEQGTSP
jgi:hypothetical protein